MIITGEHKNSEARARRLLWLSVLITYIDSLYEPVHNLNKTKMTSVRQYQRLSHWSSFGLYEDSNDIRLLSLQVLEGFSDLCKITDL